MPTYRNTSTARIDAGLNRIFEAGQERAFNSFIDVSQHAGLVKTSDNPLVPSNVIVSQVLAGIKEFYGSGTVKVTCIAITSAVVQIANGVDISLIQNTFYESVYLAEKIGRINVKSGQIQLYIERIGV